MATPSSRLASPPPAPTWWWSWPPRRAASRSGYAAGTERPRRRSKAATRIAPLRLTKEDPCPWSVRPPEPASACAGRARIHLDTVAQATVSLAPAEGDDPDATTHPWHRRRDRGGDPAGERRLGGPQRAQEGQPVQGERGDRLPGL